jgi:drug/metabolite transporter (DMT)-like permease
MNSKTRSVFSGAGLLCAAAIWGFAFVIVKDSLSYVGAIWMLAFRFTIAAVALALIYVRKLHLINKSYWIHGIVLGILLFMAYAFQTVGCKYTTAGKNAFLTTIYVFLVPLFSWPLCRRRPAVYVFICALMSVIGIGLLALGTDDARSVNIGDILTLVCGIFYAIHILLTAQYNEYQDPILLTVLQFIFAAIFSWIAAPLFDGAIVFTQIFSERVIISMLYLGLFSTMIAFVLQNVCLKYMQSSIASLFLSFESVFGILFSTLLLGEQLTLRMTAGCILIFLAVVIAQTMPDLQRIYKKLHKNV